MAKKKSEITPEIVAEHGLSKSEYEIILDRLGREPNLNELGIFSVMWSEHCSYKSSRRHLGKFLTSGDRSFKAPARMRALSTLAMAMRLSLKWNPITTLPISSHTKARRRALAALCAMFSQWARVPSR